MGMIDTTVRGDLGGVTRLADWMRTRLVTEVDEGVNQAYRARSTTEADWEGPAGETFRTRMTTGGKKADDVTENARTGFKLAEEWVRITDKHKRRMEAVRDTARTAGLTVTAQGIVDPGAGPATPTRPAAGATSDQLAQYGTAVSAHADHAKKIAAYRKAVTDIGAIRKDLNVFQRYMQNAIDDVASKPHLVATAFANDTLVAKWAKEKATKLDLRERSIRGRALADARANPHNGAYRGQPHTDHGRALRRQSQWAKWAGRAGKGARFASKVPLLGLPLAAGIAAYDIGVNDKSPSKAITGAVLSTGVGVGVGALVGGAIGGSVGNVPGAIIGGGAGAIAGLGAGALSDTLWDDHMPKSWEKWMDNKLESGWRKVTPW